MSRIICSIASLSIMIFFFGCKKEERSRLLTDSPSVNKKEIRNDLKQLVKKCRVVRIEEAVTSYQGDTSVFEYNKWGDPVSVIHSWPRTGETNVFFTYDNRRRLTEVLTDQMLYKKYFYSGPGSKQPIMDSSFTFPSFKNGVLTSYYYPRATWIFYDNQGRVIKDSIVAEDYIGVYRYSYDANGNRAAQNPYTGWVFYNYDNKVNPHVTSEIFQFVDRDYSVNNPFVADTYNVEGLPTILNIPYYVNGRLLSFLGTAIHKATIIYDCK